MDITPDLSHLTNDERKIIEAVINRQKVEEEVDQSGNEDYSSPPSAISSRHYSQSNESGVICQICQKTKFVNQQSSRQCSMCKKRFCVRCGIRLKPQCYLCNQCRQKQEQYFSSTKNLCKQYLSDYILSQTYDENQMNKHGANQNRILPKPNTNNDNDVSSPESISTSDQKKRVLPQIKQDMRSINILRDFQYHSLEERELGPESIKDSGIDTASSSTILNVISPDKFKKPMTYWRFNETRTEQIGYIYLKNNLSTYDYEQEKINKGDIFNALGLKIQGGIRHDNEDVAEITKVIPGSVADTYGQLRVGDQVLEWNGEKLTNLNSIDVSRILSHNSQKSSQIHMIVRRSIRHPTPSTNDYLSTKRISQDKTIENNSIQLQILFQYDQKDFHVMIYGARNMPIQQGLFACQLSLQHERDILSKQEKCTKAQPCSSGVCTWNQHIRFFDIDTIDNTSLWIKLVNLDYNQEILGEMKFNKLNLNNKSEWYNLNETSVNRIEPPTPDVLSPNTIRKRQLPDIPTAQLQANREKVSQDLLQKATQLALRLHMQSTNDKSLLTQRSLDRRDSSQNQMSEGHTQPSDSNARKSMINLSSKITSTTNLKEKPRIPMIRDKSAPSTTSSRRTTMTGQNSTDTEKSKVKSFDEKHGKTIKKRHSSDAPGDDIDSDGSELSSASKMSSVSMLSSHSERPRTTRKHSAQNRLKDHFHSDHEVQLNEEELRQMAMRTHDTITVSNPVEIDTKVPPALTIPTDKTPKPDQRTDGTVSDSALTTPSEPGKKRRPSMSSKAFVILGLSKKANSSSSLGYGKRYGFQRSEEIGVQPHLRNRALQRQTSKENETPASAPVTNAVQSPFNTNLQRDQYHSMPLDMKLWSGALKLPHEQQFTEFIDNLGKGQLVGRQALASPCHGEIQIGLRNQRGLLEVEIVRARNLLQKSSYKIPPAPYVKVYILDGKTCVEKQRTRTTRRTLDPLIQQTLIFKEDFRGKVLQISIWGDYGKLDRKVFLGVCQIGLDEVNLNSSQQILDWYRLFSANSLMNNYTIVQQSLKRKTSITTNDRS